MFFVFGAPVGFLEARIETLTFSAIDPLPLVAGTATTITAVPVAPAIVVAVVATVVRLVVDNFAIGGAFHFLAGVEAFALTTVLKLSRVAGMQTAVAIVPVAATVVVFVIAATITNIAQHRTLFIFSTVTFVKFEV